MKTLSSYLALLCCLAMACSTSLEGPGSGPDRDPGADAGTSDPEGEGEPGQDPEPDPGDDPPALQVTVTPSELRLTVGDTATAEAVVSDGQDDVSAPIIWESSDANIATVDAQGVITAVSDGSVQITASINTDNATLSLTVDAIAECPAGEGNNGDSCADIYQGADIWRCTVSPNLGGATVSQVCRDNGGGAEWITFHINPTECCACDGDFNVGCCAADSGSTGCP